MKRFVAALIDSLVAWIPARVIPMIGGLIGAAYMLTKDALVFELTKDAQWKNRSIGKKLMGLQVVSVEGRDVDMALSVRRNVIFAIGPVLSVVPVLGWVVGGVVGGVLGLIECLLVLADPSGRRLGDKLADTQVIATEEPHPAARA